MASYGSLSESKSPQVSRILLSILADLNSAVIWMVSTRLLIVKSSRSIINPLVTVPSAPIKIGVTVTFIFRSFFQFSCKIKVLNSLFDFFQFYPVVSRNGKVHYLAGFLFLLLTITSYGRLVEIRWSVFTSKSQRSLCVSFSGTDTGLCIYHLFVWLNFNFLHNSQ